VSDLSGSARTNYVREMFTRIAARYDLLNRLMTFGQDIVWRKETTKKLAPPPGHLTLDLGAGTGDLALEVLKQQPIGRVVAADLTIEMIRVGKQRTRKLPVDWVVADSANLPFAPKTFSGVVSGFLLRNVAPLEPTLAEGRRVLTDGGAWVALDTCRPADNGLRPLLNFHFKIIIPLLGRLIAGQPEAYAYLPESTLAFLSTEDLAEKIRQAGLSDVDFKRRMMGAVAIHWGVRTPPKA
jgi:demethylmenaquinone methyltransferase/2-methoxy-6-polyprenyl-1,4-benzoquinol methylase